MSGNYVDLPNDSSTVSIITNAVAVNPNTVLAGPTSGNPGFPTFRALVANDIPAGASTVVNLATSGNGGVTGTLPSAQVGVISLASSGVGGVKDTLPGTNIAAITLASSGNGGVKDTLPTAKGGTNVSSAGSSGNYLRSDGTNWFSSAADSGSGSGTVTSVALATSGLSIESVSGSPITTNGTLTLKLDSKGLNSVFAGPIDGSSAVPTFRALVGADIPAINVATSGNGGITGTVPSTQIGAISLASSGVGGVKDTLPAASVATISLASSGNGGIKDTLPGASVGVISLASSGNGGVKDTLPAASVSAITLASSGNGGTKDTLPTAKGGTSLSAAGSSGNYLRSDGTNWISAATDTGGGGSVTSVAVATSGQATFSVSGSPITGAGTITLTEGVRGLNSVFAGPTDGSSAIPNFRALVGADIPAINVATSGNGGITGTLGKANGGTGLSAAGSSGNVLISDGTDWISAKPPASSTRFGEWECFSFTGSSTAASSSQIGPIMLSLPTSSVYYIRAEAVGFGSSGNRAAYTRNTTVARGGASTAILGGVSGTVSIESSSRWDFGITLLNGNQQSSSVVLMAVSRNPSGTAEPARWVGTFSYMQGSPF